MLHPSDDDGGMGIELLCHRIDRLVSVPLNRLVMSACSSCENVHLIAKVVCFFLLFPVCIE